MRPWDRWHCAGCVLYTVSTLITLVTLGWVARVIIDALSRRR